MHSGPLTTIRYFRRKKLYRFIRQQQQQQQFSTICVNVSIYNRTKTLENYNSGTHLHEQQFEHLSIWSKHFNNSVKWDSLKLNIFHSLALKWITQIKDEKKKKKKLIWTLPSNVLSCIRFLIEMVKQFHMHSNQWIGHPIKWNKFIHFFIINNSILSRKDLLLEKKKQNENCFHWHANDNFFLILYLNM